MKRTRTAKKNKGIKVKRRLGGANYSRSSRLGPSVDWRHTISNHNHTPNRQSKKKSPNGRSPLSLPPLPPTTSTRPNLKLFTGLATLVALGSIPGSDASAPQRNWQSRAVDCVKTDGSWNVNRLECTGQRGLSTNMKRVTKGLDCVNNYGNWNPALGGFCQPSFKHKPTNKPE